MRRKVTGLAAVLAALSIVAAACGSDNSGSASGGATTTSGSAAATTTAPTGTTAAGSATTAAGSATTVAGGAITVAPSGPATGDPITIGTISNDGNASNSPETSDGIEMGADYLNANGGISGHPIKVIRCDEAGDADKHTACARGMISNNDVKAVIEGTPRQIAIGLPFFEDAKMPVFVPTPPVGPELKSPVTLALTGGGPLALAMFPKYFTGQGKKKFTVVAVDAASIPPLVANLNHFLEQDGAPDAQLVQYPPSTTDFTPTATAALAQNPEVIILIVAPAAYAPIVRALRDVGYTGAIASSQQQFNQESLKAAGDAADGNTTTLEVLPESEVTSPADKQMYAAYDSEVAKRGTSASGGSLLGFLSVFAFKNAVEQIGFDKASRATLLDFIQHGDIKDIPLFPPIVGRSQAPPDPNFSSLGNPSDYIGEINGGTIKAVTDRINPFK